MQTAKSLGDLLNYSIYILNGKMGLAGAPNGETEQMILTPPKYNIIYPFVNGHAIVKADEYYGVIDKYGKETIPANKHKYIHANWAEETFVVSDNHGGNIQILDANNNPYHKSDDLDVLQNHIANKFNLTANDMIFLYHCIDNCYTFEYNDKVYVYNHNIEKIIYHGAKALFIKNRIVVKDNYCNKYGILDLYGNTIVPYVYDEILHPYSYSTKSAEMYNLIVAKKNGKAGYIDSNGNTKIPFAYNLCGNFENGYAWVCNEKGKCGLIDTDGNIVEPMIHDNIYNLIDGRIVFLDEYDKERYCVKDMPKDFVQQDWNHVEFKFNAFNKADFVCVKTRQNKYGITKLNGELIIPAIYNNIQCHKPLNRNCMIARKDNKDGIIDLNNKILVPFEYDEINTIDDIKGNSKEVTYYRTRKNSLFGLLDNNFKECIPCMYRSLEFCASYNCFRVEVKNEYAFVDTENNIVVPFTSEYLHI